MDRTVIVDVDGPPTKILKIDADQFENKLYAFEERLMNKVDERLNDLECMKVKKTEKKKQYQDIHDREEDLVEKLINTSDLDSSETCLEELNFGKVYENETEIVYYRHVHENRKK